MPRWPLPLKPWPSWVASALTFLASCAPGMRLDPALPRREPWVFVLLREDTGTIALEAPDGAALLEGRRGDTLAIWPPGTRVRWAVDSLGRWRSADTALAPTAPRLVVRPPADRPVRVDGRQVRGAVVLEANRTRPRVVNALPLEAYLRGVVPREIGRLSDTLLAAAQAQAVAARTYALVRLGARATQGFDLYATVQDQAYGGVDAELPTTDRAVATTAGEVLVFGGWPIDAYYHSTCGGRTAAVEEVWPWHPPRPYLVSVPDIDPHTGQAFDRASRYFRWTVRWTAAQLDSILRTTLQDSLPVGVATVGPLRDLMLRDTTPSGRVRTLDIVTTTATFRVGGDRVRWILRRPDGQPLYSSAFRLRLERDASGKLQAVLAEGRGWGHGVGLCQVGAIGRAGAGRSYRDILRAYYPGARLVDLYE